jgi:DNA-binding NarL/FixJ family response regulator
LTARIRVLLADDHAPTREDIRFALEQDERFEICAEAPDAAAAVEASVREKPGVCLLDIRMPGWGVAAAWEIHARLPETKIVMLTVSRDHGDLFAAPARRDTSSRTWTHARCRARSRALSKAKSRYPASSLARWSRSSAIAPPAAEPRSVTSAKSG